MNGKARNRCVYGKLFQCQPLHHTYVVGYKTSAFIISVDEIPICQFVLFSKKNIIMLGSEVPIVLHIFLLMKWIKHPHFSPLFTKALGAIEGIHALLG